MKIMIFLFRYCLTVSVFKFCFFCVLVHGSLYWVVISLYWGSCPRQYQLHPMKNAQGCLQAQQCVRGFGSFMTFSANAVHLNVSLFVCEVLWFTCEPSVLSALASLRRNSVTLLMGINKGRVFTFF